MKQPTQASTRALHATSEPARPSAAGALRGLRERVSGIYGVLLVFLGINEMLSHDFLLPRNLLIYLHQAAPLGIGAIGEAFVMIGGGFDLSIGALVALTAGICGKTINGSAGATAPIMALCLGLALVVGLANGLAVTKLKVPSFIATLGMMGILNGSNELYTGGIQWSGLPGNFRYLGRGDLGPIPVSVLLGLILAVGAAIVLAHTSYGRRVFAIGGNVRTARISGVHVDRVRILTYMISSLCACLAGFVIVGYSGVADQSVGQGFEFDAIVAVVVGGVAIGGGSGSISAVVGGALAMTALSTMLNFLSIANWARFVAQGAIIVAAVAWSSRRRAGA